jgi:homoserine dehydrogenase
LNNPLKIAVAGLGTVGGATLQLIQAQADILSQRCGRDLVVTHVSARDRNRDRGLDLAGIAWVDDPMALATTDNIDVVVELIGGSEGIARDLVEASLKAGRHVVTANKALMAHHGNALGQLAEGAGVSLAYEAAVAGGIPIIKALREGLAGNRIERVYGILNGTCNYILSTMRDQGLGFDAVLADAQALGYAEADPGFDIDGVDTAHKLAILTAVAFGCEVDFDAVYTEGIRHITADDISFADELGYRIKLLGIATRINGAIEQRVHPCLVADVTPIAHVPGAFNAVVADGDFVDSTVYEGKGAGGGPTASAVVADLVDIARGSRVPTFAVGVNDLAKSSPAPMEDHVGAYYICLTVRDEPGVMADVTAAFKDQSISLESMLQRGRSPGEPVLVVLITHETREASMVAALQQIGKLSTMLSAPRMIRMEAL